MYRGGRLVVNWPAWSLVATGRKLDGTGMTPALGPGRSVLLPANPTMLGFLTIPPFLPLLLGQLVPSAILNYSMDYWVPYTQTRPFKSAF